MKQNILNQNVIGKWGIFSHVHCKIRAGGNKFHNGMALLNLSWLYVKSDTRFEQLITRVTSFLNDLIKSVGSIGSHLTDFLLLYDDAIYIRTGPLLDQIMAFHLLVQNITVTKADLLPFGPVGINFIQIRIEIHNFSFKTCIWKCQAQNVGHLV